LRAAFAVADINEDEAAEVAAGMDPAGQRDRLPDVSRAQFVAMVRAFHLIAEFGFRNPKRARILAEKVAEFKAKVLTLANRR
jgi:hypothetical protein